MTFKNRERRSRESLGIVNTREYKIWSQFRIKNLVVIVVVDL